MLVGATLTIGKVGKIGMLITGSETNTGAGLGASELSSAMVSLKSAMVLLKSVLVSLNVESLFIKSVIF